MISYQWSGRPDPDGNTFQFFKTTPGTSLNWSGISNPQIDALLDRSREVSDQAERKKIFSELTRILHDELPMVFIVHPIEPKAFSPRVQGYEPDPRRDDAVQERLAEVALGRPPSRSRAVA